VLESTEEERKEDPSGRNELAEKNSGEDHADEIGFVARLSGWSWDRPKH